MKINWWLFVYCLIFPLTLQAASFDCSKAFTKVEKLICDEPQLSQIDEFLSQQYQRYLKSTSYPATTRTIFAAIKK